MSKQDCKERTSEAVRVYKISQFFNEFQIKAKEEKKVSWPLFLLVDSEDRLKALSLGVDPCSLNHFTNSIQVKAYAFCKNDLNREDFCSNRQEIKQEIVKSCKDIKFFEKFNC